MILWKVTRAFERCTDASSQLGSQQARQAGALQGDIVVVGHPVDAGHQPAVVQQTTREVEADEARRTGDQRLARIGQLLLHRAVMA
jgi:hypothetical protein